MLVYRKYYNLKIPTMRIPIRKKEKEANADFDPHITQKKYDALAAELERLKQKLPRLVHEVQRLAAMGDFSENTAYQMAKGALRAANWRILVLEDQLKQAVVIKPHTNNGVVQLGSIVTVELDGKQKIFKILGSAEADPNQNIISYQSPIGSALMNKNVGETVKILLPRGEIVCRIIKIE